MTSEISFRTDLEGAALPRSKCFDATTLRASCFRAARHLMSIAQNPPMHWRVGSQHACVEPQASSMFEQRGGMPQTPFVQKPPQQSMPWCRRAVRLHGSSAVNARWLPPPSSWPVR